MGKIIGMTEFKSKKDRLGNPSQFGPIQAGLVKPAGESAELRQHEDEAIALGNSWRERERE
jgi:hypothetical protein